MIPGRDFDAKTVAFLTDQGMVGESALDIGARWSSRTGAGLWRGLARFGVTDYTVLELWPPGVKTLREHGLRVVEGDVRHIRALFAPQSVDIICWLHGIEHLRSWEELTATVPQLRAVARRFVLLSFPVGLSPQGPVDGNPYERHLLTIHRPQVAEVAALFGNAAWMLYPRPKLKLKPNAIVLHHCQGGNHE